jgi:uncharacterized protein YprB with RNaseH-like and TPR domain
MLEHTFIHLPGVGLATERRWWQQGILTWEDLLQNLPAVVRPAYWREECQRILVSSLEQKSNPAFFAPLIKSSEHWRFYGAFGGSCAFLDIETSGGAQGWHEITVIGLYDGHHYRAFVDGQDLEEFEDAAQHFQLVITFNGSRFDLPCIHQHFRHFRAPWVPIDLRFVLLHLGFRGGLKAIEERLEIKRPDDVRGLNGFDAVSLWNQFMHGDASALERLIRYNREDVVNLQTLMDYAYRTHLSRLPFSL